MKTIRLSELQKIQDSLGGKLHICGVLKGIWREFTCEEAETLIKDKELEKLSISSVYNSGCGEYAIGVLMDVYPIQFGVATNFIVAENGASVESVKKQLSKISDVTSKIEEVNSREIYLFDDFDSYLAEILIKGTDWHNEPWGVRKNYLIVSGTLDVPSTTLDLTSCEGLDGMKTIEVSKHELRITGVDDTTGYYVNCYNNHPEKVIVDGSIKVVGYKTLSIPCKELIIENGVTELRPYALFTPYYEQPKITAGNTVKMDVNWKYCEQSRR